MFNNLIIRIRLVCNINVEKNRDCDVRIIRAIFNDTISSEEITLRSMR
jgi:hypothetical protein